MRRRVWSLTFSQHLEKLDVSYRSSKFTLWEASQPDGWNEIEAMDSKTLFFFSCICFNCRELDIKTRDEQLRELNDMLRRVTDFSNPQSQHEFQQLQLRYMKNNVVVMNHECHPSSSSPQQRNDPLSFSPLIESWMVVVRKEWHRSNFNFFPYYLAHLFVHI